MAKYCQLYKTPNTPTDLMEMEHTLRKHPLMNRQIQTDVSDPTAQIVSEGTTPRRRASIAGQQRDEALGGGLELETVLSQTKPASSTLETHDSSCFRFPFLLTFVSLFWGNSSICFGLEDRVRGNRYIYILFCKFLQMRNGRANFFLREIMVM